MEPLVDSTAAASGGCPAAAALRAPQEGSGVGNAGLAALGSSGCCCVTSFLDGLRQRRRDAARQRRRRAAAATSKREVNSSSAVDSELNETDPGMLTIIFFHLFIYSRAALSAAWCAVLHARFSLSTGIA